MLRKRTPSHVVQCPARSAHNTWTKAMTHLEDWMLNQDTNPQLLQILTERLCWLASKRSTSTSGYNSVHLRDAIQEQDRIGWEHFLLGRISTKIRDYQQRHYEHQNSKKTGSAWCSKLINQLWLMLWKMWEHRNHINNSTITPQQRRERGTTPHSSSTRGCQRQDHPPQRGPLPAGAQG